MSADQALGSDEVVGRRRLPGSAALLIGIFTLIVSVSGGIQSSHPPRGTAGQVNTMMLALISLVVSLVCSRLADSRSDRVMAGIALGLSQLAILMPAAGYQGSYNDLPWMVVMPAVLLSTVGAFLVRQRLAAVLTTAFIAWGFWGALRTPLPGPRSQTVDGITLSVQWVPTGGVRNPLHLRFEGDEWSELRYNFDRIEVSGRAAALAPVKGWMQRPFPREEWPNSFRGSVFVPDWAISWDCDVVVYEMPKPVASAELDLDSGAVLGKSKRVISEVERTRNQLSGDPMATLRIKGPFIVDRHGLTSSQFRFLDENRRVIDAHSQSPGGSGSQDDLVFELEVSKDVKRVTVEQFDPYELYRRPLRFHFPRLGAERVSSVF